MTGVAPDIALEQALVTVSVVSHGHGPLLPALIRQLLGACCVSHIVITLNKAEPVELQPSDRITILRNAKPAGFGVNHNRAFERCVTPYFCVLNPDVSVTGDVFGVLIAHLKQHHAAIAAPLALSPEGQREDSWRYFPRPMSLCSKALGHDTTIIKVPDNSDIVYPDWVGGMCMLFSSETYCQLKGFDEGYFLYYEDVDICVRAWRSGLPVIGCVDVQVTHDAQRASRRNWRHMRWHAYSMLRYFMKHLGRLPAVGCCQQR